MQSVVACPSSAFQFLTKRDIFLFPFLLPSHATVSIKGSSSERVKDEALLRVRVESAFRLTYSCQMEINGPRSLRFCHLFRDDRRSTFKMTNSTKRRAKISHSSFSFLSILPPSLHSSPRLPLPCHSLPAKESRGKIARYWQNPPAQC